MKHEVSMSNENGSGKTNPPPENMSFSVPENAEPVPAKRGRPKKNTVTDSSIYVYSTLSANCIYSVFGKSSHGKPPAPYGSVNVHGGAGVMSEALMTPAGAVTRITEDELTLLQSSDLFRRHQSAGFVRVVKNPEHRSPDQEEIATFVSEHMSPKDNGAQVTKAEALDRYEQHQHEVNMV